MTPQEKINVITYCMEQLRTLAAEKQSKEVFAKISEIMIKLYEAEEVIKKDDNK
jgi:murein L,D-transpeptidase YcbB/YkuD